MVDFLWKNSEIMEASIEEKLGRNELLIIPSAPPFTNNEEISSDAIKVVRTLSCKHLR